MSASAQTARAAEIAAATPDLDPWRADHGSLNEAFIAALSEMPTIPKTRTADAGSYSYSYADLEGLRAIVVPILARHGMAVRTPVSTVGDDLAVTVKFLHTSGETLDDEPLTFPPGRDAQATGSAISYFRRYALAASLNLATGDDDDGAAAKPRQAKPRTISAKSMAKQTLLELCEGDKKQAAEAWAAIDGDHVDWGGESVATVKDRYLEWVNEDPTE